MKRPVLAAVVFVLAAGCGRALVDSSDLGPAQPTSVVEDAAAPRASDDAAVVDFGEGGVVVTAMTSRHSNDMPVATFGDAAGHTTFVAQNRDHAGVIVARVDANGALDATFGVDGVAWSDVVAPLRAARQNDGKYVLVGAENAVRVDEELHPDPGFQIAATERLELGKASQLHSLPDRKLLAVSADGSTVRLHRFLESGALDTSFHGNGLAVWDASSLVTAPSIAADATGRVFVAFTAGGSWYVLAWNTDGTPQAGFGEAGVLRVVAPCGQAFVRAADDGTLYVATYRLRQGGGAQGVASLSHVLANGTLDAAFTNASVDQGGQGYGLIGLDCMTDGRCVVATESTIARLLSTGGRDAAFGAGGLVAVSHPGAYPPEPYVMTAPLVDAVARTTIAEQVGGELALSLARYEADGRLDGTFGAAGTRELPFFALSESVTALVGTSERGVLALGEGIAARYTASGALDATFGADGTLASTVVRGAALLANGDVVVAGADGVERWARTGAPQPWFQPLNPLPTATNQYLSPLAVASDSSGRIVLAGFSRGQRLAHPAVVRLLGSGKFDASFAAHGAFDGDPEGAVLTDLAVDQNDGIVAVGTFPADGRHDLAVMHLDADGVADTSGPILVDATPLAVEVGRAISLDGDGSAVVAGVATQALEPAIEALERGQELPWVPEASLILARIAPDGTLASGFGQDGLVTGPEWNGFDARDVLVAPDGWIYVAGRFLGDARARGGFAVVRFSRDGQLDEAFADRGVFAPFAATSGARTLAMGADGHVFVGGYVARSPTGRDLAVVRIP